MCLCCKWEKQIPLLLLRVTNASWRRANFSKSQAFAFLAIGAGVENKEFAIPQTSCKSHQAHSYFFPKRSYLLWGGEKFENKGIKFGRWGHLTSLLVCSSSKQIQRLMVIFFREDRIKVIRSFINGMNSYMSAIGWFEIKNIAKSTTDPRVEFGLPK